MKLRGLALLWLVAVPARAQIIQIKTIPIAQGDQFQFFPANNLGMGSISIALPDSLNSGCAGLGTRKPKSSASLLNDALRMKCCVCVAASQRIITV